MGPETPAFQAAAALAGLSLWATTRPVFKLVSEESSFLLCRLGCKGWLFPR